MTSERFGTLCAVVAAVGFVAGLALLDLPGHDDGEERLNEFYSESGNRMRIILGAYTWALAGCGLIGLGATLTSRAERSGADLASKVMLLSCGAAAVMLIAAGAAQVPTYALSISAFDEPESTLTRATIPHIGYSLLLFSMLAAAGFIAAVGAAIRAARMLPVWTAWLSFVAAFLLLFSIIFMPMVLFPAWALVMAAVLWRAAPLARATIEVSGGGVVGS